MTRDEQLSKALPDHIARIRELVPHPQWLAMETQERTAAGVLAGAFLWHDTDEGWDFWNDIYEKMDS